MFEACASRTRISIMEIRNGAVSSGRASLMLIVSEALAKTGPKTPARGWPDGVFP
jgi:hypothetical protein